MQRYGKTVDVMPPGKPVIFSGVLPGLYVSFFVYISLIIVMRIYRVYPCPRLPGNGKEKGKKGYSSFRKVPTGPSKNLCMQKYKDLHPQSRFASAMLFQETFLPAISKRFRVIF